jgi:hypothetical protein
MHARHLFVLVAALGFMNAACAQPLFPDTVKPKPEPRSKPHSKPHSTPPQRTHVDRERAHEPRPRQPRASTPERSVAPAGQAQPTRTTASPPVRDVTLSRCDELRRRMEQAMREEARSGDQRRAIYQEQLRAGCI